MTDAPPYRRWPSTAAASGLTGLVIGFGGVTDDELSRALDVMTTTLHRISTT